LSCGTKVTDRSNKWWILFIYTHQQVLIVLEHSLIKGTKNKYVFDHTLYWDGSVGDTRVANCNGQKSGLLGSIIHIHAKLLLICTRYNNVKWW